MHIVFDAEAIEELGEIKADASTRKKAEENIEGITEVIEELDKVSVDSSAIRLQLDELLKIWQKKWSLLPEEKEHDEEKDNDGDYDRDGHDGGDRHSWLERYKLAYETDARKIAKHEPSACHSGLPGIGCLRAVLLASTGSTSQLLNTPTTNDMLYFYHTDHLGTPILITDITGNKAWEGEFLPFGEAYSIAGTVTNNLRFPGQYFDDETGLHQNWHRDYVPEIGRYLEKDPMSILSGDLNFYAYTGSNPLMFIDRTGLFSVREAVYHYFFGNGPVTVNFSEVDIGLQPKDFPRYQILVNSMYKKSGTLPVDESEVRDIGGWAGNTTYRLKGTIKSDICTWKFSGYIGAYDDKFDFNAMPWGTRAYWKEVITRLIGYLPGGHVYDIKYSGHRSVVDGGIW